MSTISLDNVTVARPCSAQWADMEGDERKRFCGACKLNVYNLSNMTRAEAEELIAKSEGRLCIRYFQRLDGTIMTQDCPLGERVAIYFKQGVFKCVMSVLILLGLALSVVSVFQCIHEAHLEVKLRRAIEAVEQQLDGLNQGGASAS